jgi:hypothetical protein
MVLVNNGMLKKQLTVRMKKHSHTLVNTQKTCGVYYYTKI